MSAEGSNAGSGADATAENIRWAATIKQHHYHIQDAFRGLVSSNTGSASAREAAGAGGGAQAQRSAAPVAAAGAEEKSTASDAPCVHALFAAAGGARSPHSCADARQTGGSQQQQPALRELSAWAEVVSRPAERERRREYARAMHHLATRYWDRTEEEEEENAEESGRQELPVPGQKRPREDGGCDRSHSDEGGDATHPAAPSASPPPSLPLSAAASTAPASAPKANERHNSRIAACLNCLSEYFVGKLRPPRPTAAASPRPSAEELAVYAQLPLLFARPLKEMRRQFYARHGRMATAPEVEAMIEQHYARLCEGGGGDAGDSVSAGGSWDTAMTYYRHWRARLSASGTPPTGNNGVDRDATASTSCASDGSGMETHASSAVAALPPLRLLDVGSCYGPFADCVLTVPVAPEGGGGHDGTKATQGTATTPRTGATAAASIISSANSGSRSSSSCVTALPLAVTSIDLEPYTEAPTVAADGTHIRGRQRVLQGDWLTLPFAGSNSSGGGEGPTSADGGTSSCSSSLLAGDATHGGSARDTAAAAATDGADGAHTTYPAILFQQYDAIIFCLLLSYMPTPALRYLACLKAHVALRHGGLLVILSTRTQGGRRSGWEQRWCAALAAAGFARVHRQTREKIVILSFCKSPARGPAAAAATATATAGNGVVGAGESGGRTTNDARATAGKGTEDEDGGTSGRRLREEEEAETAAAGAAAAAAADTPYSCVAEAEEWIARMMASRWARELIITADGI